MTTLREIHEGLATLIETDVHFLTDIDAIGLGSAGQAAALQLWRGFRDPRQIHVDRLPIACIETGDAAIESLTNDSAEYGIVGFSQQGMASDILIGLVWHQQDHPTAYDQRLALEAAFVDLLLRNPDVGGATTAWVREIQFDRGALHPTQTAVVTVRAEYPVKRIAR